MKEKDGWKCCREDKRIKWASLEDVISGNVENIWGPETYTMIEYGKKIGNYDITEYSIDDAMAYVPREPLKCKEEEVMKSANFGEKEITKVYADFIQHCWPSQYMSYASFTEYMSKFGWSVTDIHLHSIFRSFNYRSNGYITFHEMVLGLAAMDQGTQHGGHCGELRCGYIFRYYDVNNDGMLDLSDVIRMVNDINASKKVGERMDDKGVENDAKARMEKMGKKTNEKINFAAFLQAVGSLHFRGTSVLFRTPYNTVSKLLSKRPDIVVAGTGAVMKRKARGTCPPCRPKIYKMAEFLVQMDYSGRISAAKNVVETDGRDIKFAAEDPLTEGVRQHYRHTVFNTACEANNLLDILRMFDKTFAKKSQRTKTWPQMDRNVVLNSITAICLQAEEIFKHETRCVKVSSPCFVFGDIHGNIADVLTYERNVWKTAPFVSGPSFVFLGDYVDRGDFGIETVCYLLSLKILAPDKFFFCRGNHEIRSIQKVFTFYKECTVKYGTRVGPQIFEAINRVFDRMPICAIIDEKIYCAHGGIPTSVSKIADLMKIPTPLQEPENEAPAAWEIMWNDPMDVPEFNELAEFMKAKENRGFLTNSKRGTAYYYSEEAVDHFLQSNGLSHIIRGHEVVPLGYKFHLGGKVCTVFSSSKYCNGTNEASIIFIDNENMSVIRMETDGTTTL
ncbi:Calcineurin-like protein phosphoesterase [Leptotrombidium deliense]|uniref:Calcineurin-like protein phosphoesterase n=1 Tax=Leptotrombidium deliense TaxID=299467 RepID=A0A443SJ56_9ACAR|nr:Calcineurin-like protein phosphoesterase [Leptotrombidium deliense]